MLLILMATIFSLTVAADTMTYTYKTVGDINIEALVYLPSTDSSPSKYPVILGIHGGGYMSGKFDPFTNQEIEGITSRGWCIVSINYRLSPGVVLQDIIEDMSDAYNWIRNDLSKTIPINPDIIVVWGGSAGGGLALMAGYKLTPRPQAIVAFYPYYANFTDPSVYDPTEPVSDTLIDLANSVRQPILTEYMPDDDPNRTRYKVFAQAIAEKKAGWFLTTMNPDESPENVTAMLKDYSVVYNIDENYPPTYIIHGMLDDVTPYTQSIQAADQLSKYNVSSKLVLLPNTGHGTEFLIAEQWNQNMEPLFAFVEEEVGYRPPSATKRHIVLIIVLVVVSIVIIISSICLYKKLKLRQKKKSAQLVQSTRPDSPFTSVGAKDSPSDTATPETFSPKEVKDDQVIIEIIPKKMSIGSASVSGETNEHSSEHTP